MIPDSLLPDTVCEYCLTLLVHDKGGNHATLKYSVHLKLWSVSFCDI